MSRLISSLLVAVLALCFSAAVPAAAQVQHSTSAPVASMQRKLDHIERNAERQRPDPAPTEFSEQEVNAYFASGRVKLPQGVQRVRFQGQPGIVTALARVDFDRLTEGKRSANPLLAMFTGIHDVEVVAHAAGSRGQGQVNVDSVSIDGVGIPRMALEFFVNHYLKPKYPQVGLDTTFRMPDRIDTAVVGSHQLTVTQK